LLAEYRRVADIIVSDIWKNGYCDEEKTFNVKKYQFDVPKYLDYNRFNIDTKLSGRMLSTLVTQLSGVIRAVTEKPRRLKFIYNKLISEGNLEEASRVWEKLTYSKITKPDTSKLNIEVSSKCADIQTSDNEFGYFLRIRSYHKGGHIIYIPIKMHKHSYRYSDKNLMKSFLITNDSIELRWEFDVETKAEGRVIGADQGKLTTVTLSDGQVTPKLDLHGHSLVSIIDKMSRKRFGSKAFQKCKEHRKNYVNWSLNQLNLSDVSEFRLEKITNITYGRRVSRGLKHWTNTLIRDKVESLCEIGGVRYIEQSCTYRSQRCHECGIVRKSNRKGKEYICSNCGVVHDADYNASMNHEYNLPDIPTELRVKKLNVEGFFWKENGFFNLFGEEIGVPLDTTSNKTDIHLSSL
jgi:predicted RNA-binding Zn-ribbon protein involved in translation (DUF1610 family)